MSTLNEVAETIGLLIETTDASERLVYLKKLRNSCARGSEYQEAIQSNPDLNRFVKEIFNLNSSIGEDDKQQLELLTWQLLANSIVNNNKTQKIVWTNFGKYITENCDAPPLGKKTDIQLMIIYIISKAGSSDLTDVQTLSTIARVWNAIVQERCEYEFEFLHFIFESFLVENGRRTVQAYAKLEPQHRLGIIKYLTNYLQHNSVNGIVHKFILEYLSKEFKILSDHLLRHNSNEKSELEEVQPRIAYALLCVLASATGTSQYASIFYSDHSLFITISSLLRFFVTAGKMATDDSDHKPMDKLEQVALSSKISYDFESKLSFELKTLLVRCIANLLYKNATNQEYCFDTDLMPALLECTNMDARNPLMKEWSIIAIRNACIDCKKNQEVVSNLTQKGLIKNEITTELNLDIGALRIQSNTKETTLNEE